MIGNGLLKNAPRHSPLREEGGDIGEALLGDWNFSPPSLDERFIPGIKKVVDLFEQAGIFLPKLGLSDQFRIVIGEVPIILTPKKRREL